MKLFEKIPSSMMAVTVVMAALAPLVFVVARDSQGLMVVWMGIYIAVGVIAGLGAFFFERSKKGKADGFSKGVEKNAASAEGVKDPNRIAQIDHMRKEFQRGIDIYKRYGKDLYSLPWYVVVGEAGSGKTEALRRSEIGFPEKLQDKWQGSGGTLSMHWWFTSKAVILDTAGRLFVQDGTDGEGGQSQWVSFLQMLRKNRPDCPINGLILVIPATRLLGYQDPDRDAASLTKLDENAGQISRQMETLQTELGIRFPVYIMISKTDQIPGFREFFSGIDRADERYQMLGWSNPATLGETFSPQSVADYIQSVADRLKRRLMSELRNPEPETAQGLRINEVNALYSFPSSFSSMAPKLSRYLKQVFAADEWSAKPPFLRGIYFTSALQQGRVLDEAVAKALGIPLESMEGSVADDATSLTKNRTYFVRDLFLEKIFKEKGLVTKSDKVRAEISGWKLWFPACLALGLLFFGAMGWFTNRPGTESDRWSILFGLKSPNPVQQLLPLAQIDAKNGRGVWAGSGDGQSVLDVLGDLGQDVGKRPDFGWIFVPAQWFDGALKMERKKTYENIVAHAFGDLIKEACAGMKDVPQDAMKESHWNALRAMLLLKYATIQHKNPAPVAGGKAAFMLVVPNGGKVDSLEGTIADLVGYLGMDDRAIIDSRVKKLSSLVAGAWMLDNDGFNRSMATQIEDLKIGDLELTQWIGNLFKSGVIGDFGDFKKRLSDISAKYNRVSKLIRSGGGNLNEDDVLSLAKDIGVLKGKYPALIDHFGSVLASDDATDVGDNEKGKKEVDPREEFGDWVGKIDPSGAMGLSSLKPDESSALDEDGRKLLHDGAKLLNGIFAALSPAGDDVLFNVTEVEAVLKSLEDKPKAGDADSARIVALRRWWFEKYFFPNKFRDYLKFPLVKDGKLGSNEEIYVLLRLISLAHKLGYEPEKIDPLVAVTEALFDISKLKPGNLNAVRKCEIRPLVGNGQSVKVEIYSKGGVILASFDTRGAIKPVEGIPLDAQLEFKVEGTMISEVSKPWCIVNWRLGTIKQGWIKEVKDTSGIGLTLEAMMPDGIVLPAENSWPKLSDFASPP